MKFEFVPEICRGEGAVYEGTLIIDVPKAVERHNYIRKSGVTAILEKMKPAPGEKEAGSAIAFDLAENYEMMTNLMGFVEKHLAEIKLVRKSDGYKVDTVEKFLSIGSCEPAVMEICMLFIKGFEPGKNSEA